MITSDYKQKVIVAIKDNRENYPSDAKHATSLGISSAIYSRIKNGEIDKVLSDTEWLTIGRKLDVSFSNEKKWKVAETPTYLFIKTQLEECQKKSICSLLCDKADIGKTFTAKQYVKEHKNAIYIDCSQVKSKIRLIRKIATEFGISDKGRYEDVYSNIAYYLKSAQGFLIILDEAGDLEYSAFLELKALWNATEGFVGWYMMGADALRWKIDKNLRNYKVGYEELFSRYGSRYQRVTPEGAEARKGFINAQIAAVAKANSSNCDIPALIGKVDGSLRRVKIEILKKA